MATKEDILEQIVEEYLIHQGYFVQHNLKFRPRDNHPDFVRNQDSNYSDIDVVGVDPRKRGAKKVVAVSCKSWQNGFYPSMWIKRIEKRNTISGRDAWKFFRELTKPKWSEAFINVVYDATGSRQFTYATAVSRIRGDKDGKSEWENYHLFKKNLKGNPIQLLEFKEMIQFIDDNLSTTLATTEVGRLLQIFKAAGIPINAN